MGEELGHVLPCGEPAMTKVTFEIEQNPEDPDMWGIWEKVDDDPDNDEIVHVASTLEEAERWVHEHTPVTQEYLNSRGIK